MGDGTGLSDWADGSVRCFDLETTGEEFKFDSLAIRSEMSCFCLDFFMESKNTLFNSEAYSQAYCFSGQS